MIKKYMHYSLIILAGSLTACAPPKPAMEAPANKVLPVEERVAETKKVSSWELKGAMAAKSANKSWSASMNWVQRGINNYQIRLFGPLGSGTVIIDKKGSTVTYRDGPKTVSSQNASKLLKEQTGISLPVNNLYYWVRGLPAPGGIQGKSLDRYNHLSTLKQGGYTVNYLRYTSVNGKDLPSLIQLTGHGVSIKLVIKNWRV